MTYVRAVLTGLLAFASGYKLCSSEGPNPGSRDQLSFIVCGVAALIGLWTLARRAARSPA